MFRNDILSPSCTNTTSVSLEIKFEGVHLTLHMAGINHRVTKSVAGLNANETRITISGPEMCRDSDQTFAVMI